MTVNEVKLPVFQWFIKNEVFDVDKDFEKVLPISFDKAIDKEIVRLALKELEQRGILNFVEIKENKKVRQLYVLNKPLSQFSQTVELSSLTIGAIAEIVNKYCEEKDNTANLVDPLLITEKNIQDLIFVLTNKEEE